MAGSKDPFSANPLFRRAQRELRDQARREFRRTTMGQLLGEAERFRRNLRSGPAELGKLADRFRHFSSSRAAREILGTDIGRLAREIERYSKSGGLRKQLVSSFLNAMGPAGKMLKALIGPSLKRGASGAQREIESAINLLRAFGYELLPPEKEATPRTRERGTKAARAFLEKQGYQVAPAEQELPGAGKLPFGISEQTKRGTDRKQVELDFGGMKRRFPVTHPIVTGEMVKADSSNVHSYGYDVESWYLYVRFLATGPGGQKTADAGPLYRYHHVPPNVFLGLHDAASKGTYLWDHIRERGTVSGHQFDYALVGVTQDYVPRKATLRADGEWFVQRTVNTQRGRVLTSRLPTILVRPVTLMGSPNRGSPNRGGPNRGAP